MKLEAGSASHTAALAMSAGVLIRPIEAMLRSEQSFYLLVPSDQPFTPQARAFRDWILVEAKERTG